jgi:hypothetical protein
VLKLSVLYSYILLKIKKEEIHLSVWNFARLLLTEERRISIFCRDFYSIKNRKLDISYPINSLGSPLTIALALLAMGDNRSCSFTILSRIIFVINGDT